MARVLALDCPACGRGHSLKETQDLCPSCGGNLEAVYDYARAKKRLSRRSLAADADRTLWRYAELLPIAGRSGIPSVPVGWTPLFRAERLARGLGLREVWLKDEGRSASASFKDRASAVVVARALEEKRPVVAVASTGNAAASLACLAAGTAAKAVIFVPRSAPAPKLAQLLIFGARVVTVDGSYDDAFDLCLQACREYGWYNRSTGFNPFTREGKKTAAFELCEQLGWQVPDLVFVPVGDGNIISGIWKGLRELKALGLIERTPRLVAAQAEGSDSIARAVASGGALRPSRARTVADSISVRLPKDGPAGVRAVTESGGFAVPVSDAAILSAMRELARGANVFAEPAAAAAYAALAQAARKGLVRPRESAAVLVTGSGLKDSAAALKAAGKPHLIEPSMPALRALVRRGALALDA
ncbi:MAG: threonine synthase [Elusimicrobia bacterium]|nr:threonine synthase [Elusimicrobiota bacterium]